MTTPRNVSSVKSNLLRPALTSHFKVEIPVIDGLKSTTNGRSFLQANGVVLNQDKLNLLCSEATLPGSNLATLELTNDFHGVTERHAYRRIYDDRIDLTFYVDAENYLPIRFFETWMKYIVDESINGQPQRGNIGSTSEEYFYRVRYPDEYVAKQGLKVIKFEREYNKLSPLEYEFISSFPISVTSIPVSYESSTLLKCTVSMTYIRYVLKQESFRPVSNTPRNVPPLNRNPAPVAQTSPQTQAEFNAQNLGRIVTNEYYMNFGDNAQNATNTADFFGAA
jgi:hypothetical protein